ncbi:hypothetical protein BJ742DRAFT_911911 [Cladochytrium replicatum]|nr:hypothetical protein BJ742DRAFT_911911 [Cladochytrium replicatum]
MSDHQLPSATLAFALMRISHQTYHIEKHRIQSAPGFKKEIMREIKITAFMYLAGFIAVVLTPSIPHQPTPGTAYPAHTPEDHEREGVEQRPGRGYDDYEAPPRGFSDFNGRRGGCADEFPEDSRGGEGHDYAGKYRGDERQDLRNSTTSTSVLYGALLHATTGIQVFGEATGYY